MKRLIISYRVDWPKLRQRDQVTMTDEEREARRTMVANAFEAQRRREVEERAASDRVATRWLRQRDESRERGDAFAMAVDAGLVAGDLEAIRSALRRYVAEEVPSLLGIRSLHKAEGSE